MNVVNRLTLRHLKLNRRRTLVTIIGVILSVSMITAVTTFVASAQDLLIRDYIHSHGNWHAKFADINGEKATVFLDSDQVGEAMFANNLGYALLDGCANEYKPYLFVQEFDQNAMENMALELLEGRMPQAPDELAISDHIRYNGGVQIDVGDELTLAIGQRYLGNERLSQGNPFAGGDEEAFRPEFSREYTVVGIIARPNLESRSAPGYTVISFFDRDRLGSPGRMDVWITFAKLDRSTIDPGQKLAAAAEVPNNWPDESGGTYYFVRYNHTLMALQGVIGNPMLASVFSVFSLVAIAIIMIGSVSLIYNAFAISISERLRQLGMMASVGATGGQLRNSVFFEGLVIGLVGIPLGILAGTAGMGVTFRFVSPLLDSLFDTAVSLRLVVSYLAILAAILFSALTILVSLWIPARRAARIAPIEAIRQTRDVKLTRRGVKTSRLTNFLFGFGAELALKNLKRNRRRYRATVVSLAVSIVLFLTAAAYATYAEVGSSMFSQDYNFDIKVISQLTKTEFNSRVVALEQVDEYVYEQILYHGSMQVDSTLASEYVVEMNPEEGKYDYWVKIKSLDDASFAAYAREVGMRPENFYSGQMQAIALNLSRFGAGNVFVETEVLRAKAGDILPIELASDNVAEITLAALTDVAPMGSTVRNDANTLLLFVTEDIFAQLIADIPPEDLTNYTEAGLCIKSSEPELLEEIIREIHGEMYEDRLFVQNFSAAAEEEKRLKTLLTIFIGGFIVLISAICIANIFNTISTSIGIRRREFAMLKSVGMTPAGFNSMIRYESLFYGINALCFGLPISLAINYYLYTVMSDSFFFAFTLPWGSYGVAIAAVFTIVFVTMLYASARIKKENIIDSLRDENL